MARGPPTPRQAPHRRPARAPLRGDERAVGDFVGTLLMVVLVVALASVVAVMVASSLEDPAPPRAALSLAPVAPGDDALKVLLRNGEPIPLDALVVTLERDGGPAQDVPSAAWGLAGEAWRPGERLAIPLLPVAGSDEALRVRLYRSDANAIIGELSSRAGGAGALPSAASLAAGLSPAAIRADGVSASLVTVRVTHPEGALAVARVVVDLREVSRATNGGPLLVDLADAGRAGDAVGADGVWSGLLSIPRGTPAGAYVLEVNATDAWGRRVATPLTLTVLEQPTLLFHGALLDVPPSSSIATFRLRNWTFDTLHPARLDEDAVLLRVVSEGKAWNVLLNLEDVSGIATLRQVRVWNGENETVYAPRLSRLPLAGLDLDLLDPVGSLQLVHASGSPHPTALYQASGLQGRPQLVVAFFGDEFVSGNVPYSTDTGIYSAEVLLR